jgi:hypothetical protein
MSCNSFRSLNHPLVRFLQRASVFTFLALVLCLFLAPPADANSVIFGGGPFYSGGTATMNTLRASGYTTVMLWTIHVDGTTGNLVFNDVSVVANGAYIGNANWPSQLASLKKAPTSVNRIEVSVGSWSDPASSADFVHIQSLINAHGTNTDSILYKNFRALKTATGADAIDFDDETLYDVTTTVKFARMLASIGYKVTFCPYTNPTFWQSAYNQLIGIVDGVYLQCYAGGAGNDPASWNGYFSGLKVQPGMWCKNGSGCASGSSASDVLSQMSSWRSSAGIPGGFMWLYDDMLSCSAGGTAADYARAINQAVEPMQVSPQSGFGAIAGPNGFAAPDGASFVITNTGATALNWSVGNTSSWLTVSANSGSLAANHATTVSVNLNKSTATNLAAGVYQATILFSNLTDSVVQPRTFTLDTAISNWPIALSGFNAAIIAPSAATAANPKATSFDIPNKYSFYQSGLSGATRGLPVSGVFASLSDSHTAFQLGPYGATNALMLGYNYAKSATLTLSAPQRCNSLAILATSANGGGSGTLVLNFSDGTKSPAFNFNAQDWFGTVTNVALQGFGRLKLGSPLTVEDNGASNPNLYQTSLNLAALGLTSPISSITFFNPANAGTQQNTAVLAVSGMPTPEVTVTASWNTTNLVLNWSGNGKLLEATNIMGPWTTNVVTAPVTVTPSQEQNFYRVAP